MPGGEAPAEAATPKAQVPRSTEEAGRLFDSDYYEHGFGPVPYTHDQEQWPKFFGGIAEQMIRAVQPRRVLDVGCAIGFLVGAFWDRGVEAWGIDVSSYAIDQVRRDLKPYCKVASAADGIEGRYDLITCIEVLEHMPEDQAALAMDSMTRAADTILFSSTPYDLSEPTHFNVRPLISWLTLFQERGFAPDLLFDASFVCDHAMLLRRSERELDRDVLRLFAELLTTRRHVVTRDVRINELTRDFAQAEAAQRQIRAELVAANEQLSQILPPDPSSATGYSMAPLARIEARLAHLEAQTRSTRDAVQSILTSRIWRTLVRAAAPFK